MSETPRVDEHLLANLVPMSALRPERRRELASQASLLTVKAGDSVFRASAEAKSVIYLLDGAIEILENGTVIERLESGSPTARHGISPARQRSCEARCLTDATLIALDSRRLDVMLTWDQSDSLEVNELSDTGGGDDWMAQLLQSPAFQMVPPTNLQAIFLRMERVNCQPGEVIVKQGDAGDYFYVIIQGRCMVSRESAGQKPIRLAEFGPGSTFGEEALISDSPRNATVTMLTVGALMRLSKNDFQSLLKDPLSRNLSRMEADALVDEGRAKYLDVRLPSEFAKDGLADSLNLPLYLLRMKLAKLDPGTSYICVCDTGRRSSVASFVLIQRGFEAYVLDGGLESAA